MGLNLSGNNVDQKRQHVRKNNAPTGAARDLSDWLTLAEAAQLLECSEKTVNRYVAGGRVEKLYRRVPGRRNLPVLNPADVATIKKETVETKPFVLPAGSQPAGNPSGLPAPSSQGALVRRPTDNPFSLLQQLLTTVPAAPDLDKKYFLTIDEAHQRTGLPKSLVSELARTGKIPAIKRGAWYIWREGLHDQLAKIVSGK
jgi:hypothetical protein